jgi:glutathione S-transferase
MSSLRLYVDSRYASPYAMSVFVALTEKQLAFDLIPVNLDNKDHHLSTYSNASLTKRVPTLVHDDFALSESSAIDEYIDEVFQGTKLYPVDARHRARARQVQAWLRSDLMPIRTERSTQVIFCKPVEIPLSIAAQEAAKQLCFFVEQLLPANASNLFGEWSIADVDLSLMLQRLICNGDPVPQRLIDYANYQWQRPSIQGWVKMPRPPL